MEYWISLLALLATFYQLHLQRVHNEKSLKPIGQIDFRERGKQLSVYIQNKGVGPLIIEKLIYSKEGKQYFTIRDCLNLNPKSYMHILGDFEKKVILPGTYLEIFSTNFEEHEGDAEKDIVKKQLSLISLTADYSDIYDNKTTIERNFQWFIR